MTELTAVAHRVAARTPQAPPDAREPLSRLAGLMDAGFVGLLPEREGRDEGDGSAVVTVSGRIGGNSAVAFCTDATQKGGALGIGECTRIADAIDVAAGRGWPIIGMWHSGGAKLGDGIESMHGIGLIFAAMIRASGRIPQISIVVGPAAGGAAYGPALGDIIIMASAGRIFITGPDVIRSVTGEQIDMERLGGPEPHGRSGVAHVTAASEADACLAARRLTGLLARPGSFDEASVPAADLRALLPASRRRAYDVRPLLRGILDDGPHGGMEEFQAKWAPNIVTGMGRLGGGTLGVIANNPIRKAGCLDSESAEKAARFVRMCDAWGIPLLVVVDVPGYLPGVGQEWGGVVRRGAKLLYAFAEATVPRITLVTRKSYGGGYIAMNSRSLGATAVYAWPDAEVAVMGAESAVAVLYRKELAAAGAGDSEALRAELIEKQRRLAGGVERGIALGVINEVINPVDTSRRLAAAFASACAARSRRRGCHGNIPL